MQTFAIVNKNNKVLSTFEVEKDGDEKHVLVGKLAKIKAPKGTKVGDVLKPKKDD